MPKTTEKTEIKVKLNITPGSVSPAQKTAGRRFWRKLLAQVQEEVKSG